MKSSWSVALVESCGMLESRIIAVLDCTGTAGSQMMLEKGGD